MHKPDLSLRSLAILPIFLALSFPPPAGAEIYQWKDENGKTVISDKPPTGQSSQKMNTYGPSDTKQPTLAERELEFRKRQKDAQDKAEKSQKEETAAAEKNQNCTVARQQLKALESGERIALRNDKGERYFMDDARRAQDTEKTRRFIESECQ